MQRSRTAFTLLEMIVVLVIIGALMAILLPALQASREYGRQVACAGNLKQIGLAICAYEDTNKRLPPGAVWESSPAGKRKGSIFVYLLPFLEQKDLYKGFDFNRRDLDNATFPGTTDKIGSRPIPIFVCPSDDHDPLIEGQAVHNYAASRGPTAVYSNPDCLCNHPWSSFALAPADDPRRFAGPFTRLGATARLIDIVDGLSNTIFVGEVRPACSEHARNGWATTNNGNGYCTTIIPINYDSCHENAEDPCARPGNWNTEVGFKSAHPRGAQFLFGDISVHFLPETIDHQTYQYLGGKDDGEQASLPF